MLLGRETTHNLQRDLIELRKTLSEKITAIHTLREKARTDAAELFELKEIKENQDYLSPEFLERLENDSRIAAINDEAKEVASPEKVKELTQLFKQAEELSEAIFADGVIRLHGSLLDDLRKPLIQAIKNILNNYYFVKHAESDKKIADIIARAAAKQTRSVNIWFGDFLLNTTEESKQISVHIKEVKQQIETLFEQNQKMPCFLLPQIIRFNSEANRTELCFSQVFDMMILPDLIKCANEVMWATERAGIYNCHQELTRLHQGQVDDKTFFDYLRCEKWLFTGYGYYYLTVAPEAKNLVETELTQQELKGFLKHRKAIDELSALVKTELEKAESNLMAAKRFATSIKDLRADLVEKIAAEVLINKHEKRTFQKKVKPVVIEIPLKIKPEIIEKKDEEKHPDLSPASPVVSVEPTQEELTDQLLLILQSVLSNQNVEIFWSKLVWQTGIWWNWRITANDVKYAVPTGIYYARLELDKLSENSSNKVEVITKVCQALKNRMSSDGRLTATFYRAAGECVEGENLVITQKKLITLKKELMFNGILTEDPTAKPTKRLGMAGSDET